MYRSNSLSSINLLATPIGSIDAWADHHIVITNPEFSWVFTLISFGEKMATNKQAIVLIGWKIRENSGLGIFESMWWLLPNLTCSYSAQVMHILVPTLTNFMAVGFRQQGVISPPPIFWQIVNTDQGADYAHCITTRLPQRIIRPSYGLVFTHMHRRYFVIWASIILQCVR